MVACWVQLSVASLGTSRDAASKELPLAQAQEPSAAALSDPQWMSRMPASVQHKAIILRSNSTIPPLSSSGITRRRLVLIRNGGTEERRNEGREALLRFGLQRA